MVISSSVEIRPMIGSGNVIQGFKSSSVVFNNGVKLSWNNSDSLGDIFIPRCVSVVILKGNMTFLSVEM